MISPNKHHLLLSSYRADQRRDPRDIVVTKALVENQESSHRPSKLGGIAETNTTKLKASSVSPRPSHSSSWANVLLRQVQQIERSNTSQRRTAEQFYQWLGSNSAEIANRRSGKTVPSASLRNQHGHKDHQPTEYALALQELEPTLSSPTQKIRCLPGGVNQKSLRDIVVSSSCESVEHLDMDAVDDGSEGRSEWYEDGDDQDCCSGNDASDEEGAVTPSDDGFGDDSDDEDTTVAVATMMAIPDASLPSTRLLYRGRLSGNKAVEDATVTAAGFTPTVRLDEPQQHDVVFLDSSSSSSRAHAARILSECHLRMLRVQENAKLQQRQMRIEIEFLKHQLEASRIGARRLQLRFSQLMLAQSQRPERPDKSSVPTVSLAGAPVTNLASRMNEEGVQVELEAALERQHSLLQENLQLKEGMLKCGCEGCFSWLRTVQRRESSETRTVSTSVGDASSMDPTLTSSGMALGASTGAVQDISTHSEMSAASEIRAVVAPCSQSASSDLLRTSVNAAGVSAKKSELPVSTAVSTCGSATSSSSSALLQQLHSATTLAAGVTCPEQPNDATIAPITPSVRTEYDALGGDPHGSGCRDVGRDNGFAPLAADLADIASVDEAPHVPSVATSLSPRDKATYCQSNEEADKCLNLASGKKDETTGDSCSDAGIEDGAGEAHSATEGDITHQNNSPTDHITCRGSQECLSSDGVMKTDTTDVSRHHQEPDHNLPRKVARSGSGSAFPSSRYGRRSRRASCSTGPSLGDFLAHESVKEMDEPNHESYRGLGESVSVLSSMSKITFKSVDEDITVDYSMFENITGDSTNVDSMADAFLLPIEEPTCGESCGRSRRDSGSCNWHSRRPLTESSSSITCSLSAPQDMAFFPDRSETDCATSSEGLSCSFHLSDPRGDQHESGRTSRNIADIRLEHSSRHSIPRRGRRRECRPSQHGTSDGVPPTSEFLPLSSSEDLSLNRVFEGPLAIISPSETTESKLSVVLRPSKDSAPYRLIYPSTNQHHQTDATPHEQQLKSRNPSRLKAVKTDDLYNNAVVVAMEMRRRSSSVAHCGDPKSDKFVSELSKCVKQKRSVLASENEFRSGQPHPEQPPSLVTSISFRHDGVSQNHPHVAHQPSTYDDALMEAMRKESAKLFPSAVVAEESAQRKVPSMWKTTSVFKSWTNK